MGGTAGRTTMLGEGLQHQDGHSHVLSSTVPTCLSYDPAYVYELAVILQDGIRRMYQEGDSVFYYITMYNEDYAMPPMPGRRRPSRRHSPRHLQVQSRQEGQGHGAALRQRPDPERSLARPGDPRRKVRRPGRRLERDQLQRAPPRRARHRALEPPASRRARKDAIHRHRARKAARAPSSPPATT